MGKWVIFSMGTSPKKCSFKYVQWIWLSKIFDQQNGGSMGFKLSPPPSTGAGIGETNHEEV